LLPADPEGAKRGYVRLANPIASDRDVLRQELLSSVLENVERNTRIRERIALFEMGPVFQASTRGELPEELSRLAIVLTGPRTLPDWQEGEPSSMDFYDMKGLLIEFFNGLRLEMVRFMPEEHPTYHPGKCALIKIGEQPVGIMGELHPLVRERFDISETSVLAADLDLDLIKEIMSDHYTVQSVPAYPPILEDLAVIVDESVPAERVREIIWQAGGKMLVDVRLFDLYHGEQVGSGKKSLAYNLAYQTPDRTLTDKEALKIRQRIIRSLETDLGARLRS
jgi:phenylalanyl-tRNA synthetase beta chain